MQGAAYAAALSSLSAPRITILSASSDNGRCNIFGSSPRAFPCGLRAAVQGKLPL